MMEGEAFAEASEAPDAVLECDYDNNITNLYQAIEGEAWDSISTFLETQKWSSFFFTKDALSAENQTRTWVTRFDPNGKVRWSQLPLHAAIIFRAPSIIVNALIDLYPLSVRCTDDQQMLPLHLAVRVGAEDSIMNLLITKFPEALVTENQHGKVPYAISGRRSRSYYTESVQKIITHITGNIVSSQEKLLKKKTADFEDEMVVQTRLVKTLEYENDELQKDLSDAQIKLVRFKERCKMLERIIATTTLTAACPELTTTKSRIVSARTKKIRTMLNSLDPEDTNASTTYHTNSTSTSAVSSAFPNSIQEYPETRADKETSARCGDEDYYSKKKKVINNVYDEDYYDPYII